MNFYLEHINICVRHVDASIKFLKTAFPEFEIRHDGIDANGRRWIHIGTEKTYIALNQAEEKFENSFKKYSGMPGTNHIAYVVNDVKLIHRRLSSAGYSETTPPNSHPHRTRVYFEDIEGNDWEFVQYNSENTSDRNDYNLPD